MYQCVAGMETNEQLKMESKLYRSSKLVSRLGGNLGRNCYETLKDLFGNIKAFKGFEVVIIIILNEHESEFELDGVQNNSKGKIIIIQCSLYMLYINIYELEPLQI